MAKNPTQWIPPLGTGYVLLQGATNIQDNLGNVLIDNLGNFFVPNPYYTIGKYAVAWSQV